MLIDIHCHLDDPQFKDLDGVIERAKKAGLKIILTNGINHKTNKRSLEIAERYALVKAALGIYPTEAIKLDEIQLNESLDFIKKNKNKIIAVGEIGLDYLRGNNKEKKKKIFIELLAFAEKIKKPIIVHSRKAEDDVINILESSGIKKVILHCFSGGFELVKKAAGLGYYFSIPANIVFSQHFQKMAEEVTINQLFAETDAPYLSPFKGKRNEPAFVAEAVKKIAEIKGFDKTEVANNIFLNYQKVFK